MLDDTESDLPRFVEVVREVKSERIPGKGARENLV